MAPNEYMTSYQTYRYSEADLIKGLQNGDGESFTEIYNRFWKLLFGIAFKHLGNKESAEEVVQDIFMRIWDRRSKVEIKTLGPYLATACKYAVFKQIAKEKMRREKLAGHPNLWAVSATEVESTIEARFLEEILANAVEHLPARCKMVYKLSEEENMKIPEIANQLDISANTARNYLARARQTLRTLLRDAGAIMLLF